MKVLPYIVLVGSVLIDQLSKYLVTLWLKGSGEYKLIGNFLKLTLVYNEGSAFGMRMLSRWGYITVGVILIAFLIKLMIKATYKESYLEGISYAMIAGGAIGNLLDRIFRGAVTDFISILKFPVFNLADAFITIGCATLLLALW